MPGAVRILRVDRGSPGEDDLVRAAYDEVLSPSFSDAELPGHAALLDGEGRLGSTVLVATDDAGLAGAAVSSGPDPEGVVLLEYLAVHPQRRSGGIGGQLLHALKDLWAEQGCSLALGEVHDPRLHAEGADERPRARLAFYGRHGAWLLGVPWIQPGMRPGAPRVPGMLLLKLDGALSTARPAPVPSPWLARWATSYFRRAEGEMPEDDQFLALIGRFTALDSVDLIGVEEYEAVRPLEG